MPNVSVERKALFSAIGREFTDDAFRTLCFEFGVELDDITSTAEMVAKGEKNADEIDATSEVVYKIDVPANRYDLLCLEGISRAFRVFLGLEKPPVYHVLPVASVKAPIVMTVKSATGSVRPFAVGAVLRGVTFTAASMKSFMDLQDKLHQNIGRRRTLCAIGTHDLDTIKPPFVYDARPPADIKFVALEQKKSMAVPELFKLYRESGNKLRNFLQITEGAERHPVITDAAGTVLSLPPIINGDHSRIKQSTTNVFIECTGLDVTKLNVVVNTVVTMFSQYCSTPFTVEPVKIVYEADPKRTALYPDLSSRTVSVSTDYINRGIGIDMAGDQMASILTKMQMSSTYSAEQKAISVQVPPTRSDILHPCDIMEDVAIAWGYNKIVKTVPKTTTAGKPQPLNHLSDLVRVCIANAGYTEALTWILCSHDENFKWMNKEDDKKTAVVLANPKTIEFQVCRSSLLPGLLKTLRENNGVVSLPIRLFEVGDAVELVDAKAPGVDVNTDIGAEVGARNRRKIAALYCGTTSGFELIHGLVDRILEQNLYSFVVDPSTDEGKRWAAQQAAELAKAVDAKKQRDAKKAAALAAEAKKKEKENAKAAKAAKGAATATATAAAPSAAAEGKDKGKKKGDSKAAPAEADAAKGGKGKDKKKGDAKDEKAGDAKDAKKGAAKAAKSAPAKEAEADDSDDELDNAEHERLRLAALQKGTYFIRPSAHDSFFPGRRADVFIHKKGAAQATRIGTFGIVHPTVLQSFSIPHPCSAVELEAEAFLD